MSDSAACCDCCDPVGETTDAIESYTGIMAPELEVIRSVGFGLIYQTGKPVPVGALARRSGLPKGEVEARIQRIEAAGRARRDEDGRLVGIAGLSLEPTPHAVQIEGRDFWTWCALDAVGIFSAMGATGSVFSSPPGNGASLNIEFRKGVTESDVAVFIASGYDGTDVVQSWCPNVNFFASADEAHSWAKHQSVGGDVVTIPDIAQTAGSIWEGVVNGTHRG